MFKLTVFFLLALTLLSCAKKPTVIDRLAILPANLLISDPSFEWLKTAVPIALQYDLSTARTVIPGISGDESGAAQAGATRLLRTSLENRQGGIHIESTIIDVSTQKVIRVESSDASSASVVLPAINALAKKIDPAAIAFSTAITPAWQALTVAEENNNPQQRAQFLNQAISRDQNFGYAWVSLLEMVVPGRQADLTPMIDAAKAHRAAFSPFDRAQFDVIFNRLSNAAPKDQIVAAQLALSLAPNDLQAMVTLGNYQILEGDSAAGEQSLRRAAALNPANVNLRFQLARGLTELRKFKDAQTIFASINNTPAVYPEMATCILLQGDKVIAAQTVEKFFASVQNDDLKPMLRADWEVISGDRQKGLDLVLATKFNTPNIRVLALAQAAIWQMMGNDYPGAQKTIVSLNQSASGQQSPVPAVVALLADNTSSVADWRNKVENASLPAGIKDPTLAYGYFLRGNFEQAAKVWQQVDDQSHGVDLHARAMLASSFDHLGKRADAQRINIIPFTPEFTDLYSAVAFTEMHRMLAK